jgi:mRNA interferase HicA
MKYSELEKQLRSIGCVVEREGKRHRIWYSPLTGQRFSVGRHKTEDVPNGTLKTIRTSAGLE